MSMLNHSLEVVTAIPTPHLINKCANHGDISITV